VHGALESLSVGMAERVAALLQGRYRIPYLARTVSGAVDVDRADYLLRDSHMTGVRYGLYDLDWLLQALSFAQVPTGDWVLAVEGRKGIPPVEAFFFARHHMFQQVYHHKATRAAEALVRTIFTRARELVRDGAALSPLPAALRAAFLGEPVSLGDYLELDDAILHSCFAAWAKHEDHVLSQAAARLRSRRLPKTVPLPPGRPARWERARARAAENAGAAGLREDLSVFLDVASDTAYDEPDDDGPGGLWVRISHRPIRRLGQVSFLLGELCGKRIEHPRLIFPAALRDEILDAIAPVLDSDDDA